MVTTGWLRRLLDTLHRDPQIGLVGPVSNRVSGPQQIPVDYDDLAGLDGFAWEWGRQHAGQVVELDRLVGFCLLIRREVVDRIGLLDERFGLGNFEDDDYCRRAREAGFRTVVAVDSFVHHFGGRTFVGSGVDFASLMAANERQFHEKWHDADRAGLSAMEPPASTSVGPCRPPRSHAPRLSLCMIVRDNEQTIRPCLESIRPWVDEMIVVDTGSTDATPRICEELGARVSYRAILAGPAERHFASVDAGLAGDKARHNLALVFEDQANFQAAESEWRTILAERPEYLAARSGLIECLLHQRRLKEAESELELLKVRSASPVELRRLSAHRGIAHAVLKSCARRHEGCPWNWPCSLRTTPSETMCGSL
jgi:cellulose synthase/poly-beta-1,6-N-acetylglucosamine synthase-like glycosyltransferase